MAARKKPAQEAAPEKGKAGTPVAAKRAPAKKAAPAGEGKATRKPSAKTPAKPASKAAKKAPPAKGKQRKVAPAAQAEKRPPWRPSEYRPEYCQKLIDYFSIAVDRVEEVGVPTGKRNEDGSPQVVVEHRTVLNTFPTLTRFAAILQVSRQTLHNWANEKDKDGNLVRPDFFDAYARAREGQESLLIEGGLSGAYDGRFAGLAAKNLIGWRDQVEQKVEQTITTASKEDLDKLYDKKMAEMAAARAAALARENGEGQGK